MSDAPARAWRHYIDDMIRFAERATQYTHGIDRVDFLANSLVYDATLRNLELIGEAATHVPEEIRAAHPDVPWRLTIATRNRLIHAYLGIDDDIVWTIVRDDLPALLIALRGISGQE